MSSELQRFNDTFKEDAGVRKGAGGQLAAKYNLPVKVSISIKPGSASQTSITVTIPKDEIAPLVDELKALLGGDAKQPGDLNGCTQITYGLDSQGELVPGSLKVEGPGVQPEQRQAVFEEPREGVQELCEKCKVNQGPEYGFYYGKVLSRQSYTSGSGAVKQTTTTTNFEVGGRMIVPLCDSCRRRHYLTSLVKGLILTLISGSLLVYFLVAVASAPGGRVEPGLPTILAIISLPIFSGPLALGGLAVLFNVLEDGQKGAGERLAADLKRDTLKAQGYDKTWTSRRYKQIKTYHK